MKLVPMFAFLYCVIWPFFQICHPNKPIHKERLPEGGAILCPNHTTMGDPIYVIYALGWHNMPKVMGKAELLKIPVLGWLLQMAGVIGVDRGKADVGALKRAMKCLKDGEKLLMFPEGTRSKTGDLGEAKTGAAMLALRTGVPIVPMYLPAQKKWFHKTPVVFGEPFMPQVEGRRPTPEDYERVASELMERIAALEAEVR